MKDYKENLQEEDPEKKEPEVHIKAMLPTFTPIDLESGKPNLQEKSLSALDYEEGLFFGESQYAQMARYYMLLARILELEWFINKI